MNSLRNPKWLFLVNTAPVLLLLAICYGEFAVVRTLLPAESLALWQQFGLVLALLGVGGAGYATAQLVRRQPLSAIYSLCTLLAYSWLLCSFTGKSSEVLPWSVPRWMVPTDLVLMAWTFLMPTLAHAVLTLVAKYTPDNRSQSVLTNIVFAGVVPIAWALIFWVLSGVAALFPWPDLAGVVFVTAMVISTLSFFFFLVRAVYIMALRNTGFWAESGMIWKGLLTILLPLVGLAVNNGVLSGRGFEQSSGIFGNFTSPWFYALAVLNGALLCVPSPARALPRLLLLVGRSALFAYTLYFFLVFLPFLPLSIPAIILLGVGFLLMTPVLLFVIHVRQLSVDWTVVRALYSKPMATAAMVAGLSMLPLYISFNYWHNRRVLHEALAYVYTPDYSKPYAVDASALEATLAVVKQNKARGWDFLYGAQQPYLSAYFNWLVLDNLMLSDAKINDLEQVFSGIELQLVEASTRTRNTGFRLAATPVLQGLSGTSTYDARQQAWVSWVDMEIANSDPRTQNGEYSTKITLPAGCWVSDYYLTIGQRQERGILAEKKAALWVFAQIVNENQSRDPGLVNYLGTNEVAVRVYPVMGAEPRRTRIQFLHKEPCTLSIDGQSVALGDATAVPPLTAPVVAPGNGVAYVSSQAKQRLPLVQRRPYYHFLIDATVGQGAQKAAYQARIVSQLAQSLPNAAPARFSLVDAYTTPIVAGTSWQQALDQHTPRGGFFLTGALRRTLFEAQQQPAPSYPVLVVVTDHIGRAVLDENFEDFSSAYPESDVFYVLNAAGELVPHSLRHSSRTPLAGSGEPPTTQPVRAWPDAAKPRAYLPNTQLADVVLAGAQAVPEPDAADKNRWMTGLLLRGYSQWQSFHPEATDRQRVPFIQASFQAGIMTPFTSFLALENEAQKAALRRKQKEVLAANASLDTMEGNQQPPVETPIDSEVWILLTAGALLAGWSYRRSMLWGA